MIAAQTGNTFAQSEEPIPGKLAFRISYCVETSIWLQSERMVSRELTFTNVSLSMASRSPLAVRIREVNGRQTNIGVAQRQSAFEEMLEHIRELHKTTDLALQWRANLRHSFGASSASLVGRGCSGLGLRPPISWVLSLRSSWTPKGKRAIPLSYRCRTMVLWVADDRKEAGQWLEVVGWFFVGHAKPASCIRWQEKNICKHMRMTHILTAPSSFPQSHRVCSCGGAANALSLMSYTSIMGPSLGMAKLLDGPQHVEQDSRMRRTHAA